MVNFARYFHYWACAFDRVSFAIVLSPSVHAFHTYSKHHPSESGWQFFAASLGVSESFPFKYPDMRDFEKCQRKRSSMPTYWYYSITYQHTNHLEDNQQLISKLVGGLEHFLYSHIFKNFIIPIPIDFHNFQRGSNHQPEIDSPSSIIINHRLTID